MRLNGNKFIPGIRIEVQEDEPETGSPKSGKEEILKSEKNGIFEKIQSEDLPPPDITEDSNEDADVNETFETYPSKFKCLFSTVLHSFPDFEKF